MRLPFMLILTLAMSISFVLPDHVASEPKPDFPRFGSLRASTANLRIGPGRRYPIDWVFVRRGLPIQIIGAFETWRRVRDWEGTEGWIHQSLLSKRRSVIVLDGQRALRRTPSHTSPVIARIERGVIGRALECRRSWCRVEIQGLRGWIDRKSVWGVKGAGKELR